MNTNMQKKMYPLQVLCVISAVVYAAFYNYYATLLMILLFKAMTIKDNSENLKK